MTGLLRYAARALLIFLICLSARAKKKKIRINPNNPKIQEVAAQEFIIDLGEELEKREHKYLRALWKYDLDRTEKKLKKLTKAEKKFKNERLHGWKEVRKCNIETYTNREIEWMMELVNVTGADELEPSKYKRLQELIHDMTSHYKSIKIRKYMTNTNYLTVKDALDLIQKTQNEEELRHYFVQWFDSFGPNVRKMYIEYIDIIKEIARLNYISPVHYWNKDYGKLDIAFISYALQRKVKNLYQQLHAYVRYHLLKKYGRKAVNPKGAIPIHLLGDLQGANWMKVYKDSVPYQNRPFFDYTTYMQTKNYTVKKVVKLADDFYQSMDLMDLPKGFYKKSILERPKNNTEFDCTPSVWDFQDEVDFRLRMCGEVNEDTLKMAFEKLGILQYKFHYQRLPYIFRQPVTEGFEEGVGVLPHLTVFGPRYLFKKKFIRARPTKEDRINYLYRMALEKLVFLPYAFSVERWRWDVLNGTISYQDFVKEYWRRRLIFTGIEPPTLRTETMFDPGTRYEILSGEQYLKKFVGTIVGFQLHEELCKLTKYHKYFKPEDENYLHKCSLYGKKTAGKKLSEFMNLGRTKPWFVTMRQLFFENRRICTGSMFRFFKPLYDWLISENRKNNVFIGWKT